MFPMLENLRLALSLLALYAWVHKFANFVFLLILWYYQISVKEDKHKKEVILFAVNRNHPDYTTFKPEKRKVEKNEQTTDHVAGEVRSHKILGVAEIYKPSVQVNPIFNSVGADKGKLYSASEATDIVFSYIEKENLVKPTDKSFVVLDATLCDALFKGAIKKGSTYPTEIHKKDLGPTFINRMQAHHRVTRGSESVVRKGSLKTIQIMTERRQGNKKVTKLSGVESFLIDAEALASELQKKFACSTSVAELPGMRSYHAFCMKCLVCWRLSKIKDSFRVFMGEAGASVFPIDEQDSCY